jgi:hypothetical protein
MLRLFIFGCFILVIILITSDAAVAALGGAAISVFFVINRYRKLHHLSLDSAFTFGVYSILSNFSNFRGIFADQDRINGEGYYVYSIPEYAYEAFTIQTLGTWFILLGFLFAELKGFSFPMIKSLSAGKDIKKKLLFIGFLFVGLQLVSLPAFLGAFNTVIETVPLAIIMLLATSEYSPKEKQLKVFLYTLLFAATLQKVLSAYLRMEMILPAVAFFIGYFYKGKGSIKQLLSVRLIPLYILIFLFVSAFGFLGKNRSTMETGWGRIEQISGAIFSGDNSVEEEKGQGILTRLSNINQLTNVVDLTEKKGLYMGQTLVPLAIAFIPRFLWPDKPIIAPGVWFALEINRAILKDNGRYSTSINITVFGEFFLNFGWPGLIIGCFAFGIFWGMLWKSSNFEQKEKNILGTFFGFYLLYIGFFGLGAGLHSHITVLGLYLIFLFISQFLKFHQQRRNENTLYRPGMARK